MKNLKESGVLKNQSNPFYSIELTNEELFKVMDKENYTQTQIKNLIFLENEICRFWGRELGLIDGFSREILELAYIYRDSRVTSRD